MSDFRRPPFLVLVPAWQQPLELTEPIAGEIQPAIGRRRYSQMSVSTISSTTSSTTGYGENGFLILTTTPNVEEAVGED